MTAVRLSRFPTSIASRQGRIGPGAAVLKNLHPPPRLGSPSGVHAGDQLAGMAWAARTRTRTYRRRWACDVDGGTPHGPPGLEGLHVVPEPERGGGRSGYRAHADCPGRRVLRRLP